MDFFKAGATHRERLILGAHRIGKTYGVGSYETALHLTGRYPPWWEGKRFNTAPRFIASGRTAKETRDYIQITLFGPPDDIGTGMIPKDAILRTTPKHGLAEAYDTAYIKHISGGTSRIILKSYDSGVEAFYGVEAEGVFLDEEPPMEIETQCLMRTMTTGGIVYITMTPLQGRTVMIDEFLRSAANRDELEYK